MLGCGSEATGSRKPMLLRSSGHLFIINTIYTFPRVNIGGAVLRTGLPM